MFAAMLLAGALLAPSALSAQASQLDVAQAQEFLGNWNLTLQSEMGPLPLSLNIQDQAGKVAVVFGSEQGTQAVENVTRQGDTLVLNFTADGGGQAVDILINLVREGEGLRANLSAMAGAFVASGVAARVQ
jgi:hypothetical protein